MRGLEGSCSYTVRAEAIQSPVPSPQSRANPRRLSTSSPSSPGRSGAKHAAWIASAHDARVISASGPRNGGAIAAAPLPRDIIPRKRGLVLRSERFKGDKVPLKPILQPNNRHRRHGDTRLGRREIYAVCAKQSKGRGIANFDNRFRRNGRNAGRSALPRAGDVLAVQA